MSLYRTWRPKSFGDLVGQDAVVRTLRTALSSGKLAHAYLFSGPRGSGKTSAARILARCIDCVLGPTPDPDNTCDNCLAILAGTALDVIEIDAASNRGIDEMRSLRDSVRTAPASMRTKVYVIDEAHMLTREANNAFLKTLEEPPPHVVFILATTAPESLPPTILSRCQRYAFRRIPVGVMIERMREIASAEGIAIDDGALGAIAYRAEGGLRDALTMLEQVASYAGGAVDAATVEAAFGATGRHYSEGLVDAILAGNGSAALRIVDEASDAGAEMTGLVRGAIAEYRNLLVARIDPELLARDLSPTDAKAIVARAATTAQPKIVRGLRLLAEALAAGRISGNPRLELETALLRLIVQAEDPSLDALAARVALLEAGGGERPATAVPKSAEPAAAKPSSPAAAGSVPSAVEPPRVAPALAFVAEPEPEPKTKPQREPKIAREREPEIAPAAVVEAVSEPPARVAEAPPNTPPSVQQVRSQWDQIRARVREKDAPVMVFLSRATVDSIDGSVLTVGIGDAMQGDMLRARVAILEAAVEEVLRIPLRVVVRSPAAGAQAVPRTSAQRATPPASASEAGGEIDLLAYARSKIGGTENA